MLLHSLYGYHTLGRRILVYTRLGHCAKYRIVATDAWSMLIIILLCVAHFIELRLHGGRGKGGREGERESVLCVCV